MVTYNRTAPVAAGEELSPSTVVDSLVELDGPVDSLDLELDQSGVDIGLSAKFSKSLDGVLLSALADEPTRGLDGEENETETDDRGNALDADGDEPSDLGLLGGKRSGDTTGEHTDGRLDGHEETREETTKGRRGDCPCQLCLWTRTW